MRPDSEGCRLAFVRSGQHSSRQHVPGHLLAQRLGFGNAIRDPLVIRANTRKPVAMRAVTGNRARAGIAPVPQTAGNETHSGSALLQRSGVEVLHTGLDHRDGVKKRAGQRNVDVVDDQHHLAGL